MSTRHAAASPAPSRTWERPLSGLRAELEREAADTAPRWAWRILPRGACVAVQVLDDTLKVRIARPAAPAGADLRRWEQELATFRRELCLDGWEEENDPEGRGVAVVFSCRAALICRYCRTRKLSENGVLFGGEACDHCALHQQLGRTP